MEIIHHSFAHETSIRSWAIIVYPPQGVEAFQAKQEKMSDRTTIIKVYGQCQLR